MDITVRATKGSLLIDSVNQLAYMLPADVEWNDDQATGSMHLTIRDGRLIADSLTISGPEGFDAVEYAQKRMRAVIRDAKTRIAMRVNVAPDGRMVVDTDPKRLGVEQGAKPKRSWRKLTPDFLEAVSRVYMDAKEQGHPPVVAVIDEFQVSRNTANDWLKNARERGFLPPSDR